VTRPSVPFAGVAGPLVIGHRGGSLEAPENTLAAFKHALAAGTDWQELDVTLTSDDAVIVIHDDTLDRTTDGKGLVTEQPLAALKKLTAGKPRWPEESRAQLALFNITPPDFGERYAAERLPTLAEVLALPNTRIMIEMKKIEPRRVSRLAEKVIEVVHAAQAADRVVIASFEADLLWAVQARDPSLPLLGLAESSDEITKMLSLPIQVLGVRIDHVAEARERASAGTAIWAWTAYNADIAKAAVEQGAHGIITDAPAAVLAVLRPAQSAYIEKN
jgi:glycerophosphoryl diester phosphodiesterase